MRSCVIKVEAFEVGFGIKDSVGIETDGLGNGFGLNDGLFDRFVEGKDEGIKVSVVGSCLEGAYVGIVLGVVVVLGFCDEKLVRCASSMRISVVFPLSLPKARYESFQTTKSDTVLS